jgi:hypothetical protein
MYVYKRACVDTEGNGASGWWRNGSPVGRRSDGHDARTLARSQQEAAGRARGRVAHQHHAQGTTLSSACHVLYGITHRFSINRPTKRGKENSRSDGHCQCEKEMEHNLLACQLIFEIEPLIDTLW